MVDPTNRVEPKQNPMLSYSKKIMKLKSILKSITMVEILVMVVFILYIVLPIPTPSMLSPYVNSPLGMIVMFCITIALFVYSNPILAILYIFVAYFLLSRSMTSVAGRTAYVQYTPTTQERKAEVKKQLKEATPPGQPIQPQQHTLEEDVVNKMAPIGKSDPVLYTASTFKPVATDVQGASTI